MPLAEGRQLFLAHAGDGRASDADFAPGGLFHARQLVEQSALAGAGGAEDAAYLPPHDGKVDVFEGHHRLVPQGVLFAQAPHFHDGPFARRRVLHGVRPLSRSEYTAPFLPLPLPCLKIWKGFS